MKSETLKSALNAHGWVGLFISLPLFIVFWAGAITLFHPEFDQWAKQPYYQLDLDAKASGNEVNYNDIVESQLAAYQVLPGDRISIRPPTEKSPYLRVFFRAPVLAEGETLADFDLGTKESEDKPKLEKKFVDLLIDPYSGEVFTDHNAFELADFLYVLHYNLHLPQGLYIVINVGWCKFDRHNIP